MNRALILPAVAVLCATELARRWAWIAWPIGVTFYRCLTPNSPPNEADPIG